MDAELGRSLDSLSPEERGNTIIIYIGDNGTPRQVVQGYRDARGKGSVYEGGVGVPLIVSGGGIARRGDRESALVASVDLYATIAELAGSGVKEINDSKSFAQLLVEPATGRREFVYAEFADARREDWTIRNDRFKLVSRSNVGDELYSQHC